MDKKLLEDPLFVNCLRIQIAPEGCEDEKIESIKDFALEFGFSNIILLFNSEQLNQGHITRESLDKWLPTLKKARDVFLKAGLTVSLNPFMEIGHIDRGRKLHEGQHFQTMVDRDGKQSSLCACFLDKEWQAYYFDIMPYYVRELEPSILWIEDDFRLHNHKPLNWGGCFCPLHIEEFSKRLGRKVTREELVEGITAGEPNEMRKVWLDESWATVDGVAKKIGPAVKEASPSTSVGLMSSMPKMHFLEARHWKELHKDLSSDGVEIDRIHLPEYIEPTAKRFVFEFSSISLVNRTFMGDDVLVYPEFESDPDVPYTKDNTYGRFVLKTACALGIEGMTYNIFPFVGNGANDEDGLGTMVKGIQPYLDAVKSLRIRPGQMEGPVFPLDEDTSYRHVGKKGDFDSLYSDELDWIGTVAGNGVSFRLSTGKSFKGECVFLIGQNARNFSDDELEALFKDNFVYLDGETALVLQERGLLGLIGATKAKRYPYDSEYQKFEQLDDVKFRGITHYRMQADSYTGDYVSVDFKKGAAERHSTLMDEYFRPYGRGYAIGKGFFLNPYCVSGVRYAQFDPFRRAQLIEYAADKAPVSCVSAYEGVTPYLYKQDGRRILLLANANATDYETTSFHLHGVNPKSIKRLAPDGSFKKVAFEDKGRDILINEPLAHYDVGVFIIE